MTEALDHSLVILVRDRDGSVEKLPHGRMAEIDEITGRDGTLVWVSASKPSGPDITSLAEEFALHPLAIEDLRKQRQRPKLDHYERQHMIVAYEAVPDTPTGLAEIHIFVSASWLLSVRWASTPMLDEVLERFAKGHSAGTDTVGELLYQLLDAAVDSYFPELDRISDRINALEDRVLEGEADRDSLAEILFLKRRLVELRRILAPMRDMANGLLRRDLEIVQPAELPYFQDLYDHLVRVLDQLDVYRDLLAAVLDARLSVASNSLNAIMKRLTAFTVVLMVPTLIAGIYGMNFTLMPELEWALGYPFALILMLAAVIVAITFFRRRDWF